MVEITSQILVRASSSVQVICASRDQTQPGTVRAVRCRSRSGRWCGKPHPTRWRRNCRRSSRFTIAARCQSSSIEEIPRAERHENGSGYRGEECERGVNDSRVPQKCAAAQGQDAAENAASEDISHAYAPCATGPSCDLLLRRPRPEDVVVFIRAAVMHAAVVYAVAAERVEREIVAVALVVEPVAGEGVVGHLAVAEGV